MPKRARAPAGCFWRDGVLYGRVRVKGRLHKWTLQTDDPAVARARRKAGKARLVAAVIYGDARLTFTDVLAQWVPWVKKQVGPRTAERYGVSMGRLEPILAGKHLDEVNGALVAEIIRWRQAGASVTNATIKRDLVALSSVMNFAMDQGWVEANPVLARMRRLKENRDPITLPQEASVRAMIQRAPGLFSAMIAAARVTGARQEELADARRQQLNPEARTLTVIGKGNKRRVIDLNPFDGWKAFAGLPAAVGGAFLFWHGDGARYANVASRFAALCRELSKQAPGFVPFRFHDLRHLHAVEYLRAGGSIYDLQKRLGHASIKTTEGYLEFLTPDQQRVAKQEASIPKSISSWAPAPSDQAQAIEG